MSEKIVINGKEYTRVEDMPPDVRALYDQALTTLEGRGSPNAAVKITTHVKLTINGKTYDSPEAMPPEVRRIYDAVQAGAGSKSFVNVMRVMANPERRERALTVLRQAALVVALLLAALLWWLLGRR